MLLRQLTFIILTALVYLPSLAFAQSVRASYSGLSGQNLPFWLTYDAGLYKKYGLNTEILLISGGLTNIQAVLANEINFTYLGGASPIQAAAQGANVVVLATAYGLMPYCMVGAKNIQSPMDLKGKYLWCRALAASRKPLPGWRWTDWASARATYPSCKPVRTPCVSLHWNRARRKRPCSHLQDCSWRPRAVSICWRISVR